MNHQTDLLDKVVAELEERKGDLPAVAAGSGIPYDTVLRIKNRENDPGYSKVRRLADYLFAGTITSQQGTEGAPDVPQEEGAA